MALVTCPECGHQISSRAIACPQCACPLQEQMGEGSYDDPALLGRACVLAPIWVAQAVGSADGKYDNREKEAFSKTLAESVNSLGSFDDTEIVLQVLQGMRSQDWNELYREAFVEFSTPQAELTRIRLGMQDPAGVMYRNWLIALGLLVAQASGGLGGKVSNNEMQILCELCDLLGVDRARLTLS